MKCSSSYANPIQNLHAIVVQCSFLATPVVGPPFRGPITNIRSPRHGKLDLLTLLEVENGGDASVGHLRAAKAEVLEAFQPFPVGRGIVGYECFPFRQSKLMSCDMLRLQPFLPGVRPSKDSDMMLFVCSVDIAVHAEVCYASHNDCLIHGCCKIVLVPGQLVRSMVGIDLLATKD